MDLALSNFSIELLIAVFLFFISAIIRKQASDFLGYDDFNVVAATALSTILVFALGYFFSVKFAFFGGLIGMLVGGIGAGFFIENGGFSSDGDF